MKIERFYILYAFLAILLCVGFCLRQTDPMRENAPQMKPEAVKMESDDSCSAPINTHKSTGPALFHPTIKTLTVPKYRFGSWCPLVESKPRWHGTQIKKR